MVKMAHIGLQFCKHQRAESTSTQLNILYSYQPVIYLIRVNSLFNPHRVAVEKPPPYFKPL